MYDSRQNSEPEIGAGARCAAVPMLFFALIPVLAAPVVIVTGTGGT
ncbi:MAG: hypothetical protein GDA35_06990 [Hyphomonadaceae bacterium]|nr:hypothetical protein [Hyphomonadaceae bacterium]